MRSEVCWAIKIRWGWQPDAEWWLPWGNLVTRTRSEAIKEFNEYFGEGDQYAYARKRGVALAVKVLVVEADDAD